VNVAKKRILVVDDEENIVELIKVNLEASGYLVDAAYDGEEAISKVCNMGMDRPDLVILDVKLPKIDGFEVARQIKRNAGSENIPIIMLTAKGQPLDKITGLVDCQVDDYLVKPVDINDLLVRVMKKIG
jgi:two-component system alkaline phosphatase synthesis response regulator PhoP